MNRSDSDLIEKYMVACCGVSLSRLNVAVSPPPKRAYLMNIKKEVVRRIQDELEKQQRNLRYHLEKNAIQINKLSEDSAVTKKQLSMLNSMIREVGGDK